MHAFNESFSYDRKMYKADILGSQAYSKGLLKAGILDADEQKVGIGERSEDFIHLLRRAFKTANL
jgi:argininosuccinate lyase